MRQRGRAVAAWTRTAPVLARGPGAALAVPIAVLLGYSYGVSPPGGGLDQGWQLALSLARLQDLTWGRDLTFTYGPWGLVSSVSPLSGGLVLQALVAQLAALAVTGVGAWHLAAGCGRWAALVLTVLVAGQAGSLGYATTVGLAVTLLCLCHLTGRLPSAGWPPVIGALAGFALLVKFNVGVTALAVAGVTAVLAVRPVRCTALVVAGAVTGALGGWLLAGQPLGAAADWVRQSLDVASAYSSAMGHRPDDRPSLPGQWAALGAVATLGILVIGVLATRALGRRAQLATAAVLLVTMVSAYLASSTRLDAGHAQFLLVTAFVVGAPLAAAVSWPRLCWLPWTLVAGMAAAELAVGTAIVGHGWHSTVVHPVRSVQDLRRAGELVVSGPDRAAVLAGQKAVLRTAYQSLIPQFELEAQDPPVPVVTGPSPAVVQALAGARVHAEPWAVGLVWAHDLRWAPGPVFQTYSAYTPLLDRLNARALAGPRTTGVLRQSAAIDGKHPLWESPRYQVQLLCRFREVAADAVWQALRRGPDRCGQPLSLGAASAGPGEAVTVPTAPGALVVATVRPRDGGPGVQGDHPTLRCDDRPYRVAQGFPSGPLVLDASAAGWSSALLPAPCRTLRADAAVDIAFIAVPMRR
jgi:hypothetical protein